MAINTAYIVRAVTHNRVYRSVVRHGTLDTNRNRALLVFSNFFLHIHPVKVNIRAMAFTRTFYLGGLSAAAYFILVVTGVFLMFYYHPSVPRAYEDMKVRSLSCMGLFLRLHRWAAHAMAALVLLHRSACSLPAHIARRASSTGPWRHAPPRHDLLSYTGHLRRGSAGVLGVTVGTNMADAVPRRRPAHQVPDARARPSTRTRCFASTCFIASCSAVSRGARLGAHLARPQGRRHLPIAGRRRGATERRRRQGTEVRARRQRERTPIARATGRRSGDERRRSMRWTSRSR
jgi:hypothetical protein